MRFMVLVQASEDSEAGIMPTEEQLADMGKFNEEIRDQLLGLGEGAVGDCALAPGDFTRAPFELG